MNAAPSDLNDDAAARVLAKVYTEIFQWCDEDDQMPCECGTADNGDSKKNRQAVNPAASYKEADVDQIRHAYSL